MASDWKIGSDNDDAPPTSSAAFAKANDGQVAWDTEAPADFTYVYHPDRVLVRSADVEEFDRAVARLDQSVFKDRRRGATTCNSSTGSWCVTCFPSAPATRPCGDLLDLLEESGLRRGAASPDHWVHVAPGGPGGSMCPAVEPEETGLTEPWPPDASQGKGSEVSVVVVDTGWHPPAATDPRTPWLKGVDGDDELNGPDLRPYAGHGTFIAGVVRCIAPVTRVYVEGFAIGGVGGGGILESDLVVQLEEALDHDPQVINLSAGCRTRLDLPSIALETFYRTRLRKRDCVLVAAAGNDSWAAPFWPAAFDWCVGVGSLDRDGRVSDFSNFGVSADVYALGRNLVNAFPDGTFECHETPDKGDIRVFSTGLARWSGTSFSAPVVAGLIAREISETGVSAADARDVVLARAVYDSDPTIGPLMKLRQPYA